MRRKIYSIEEKKKIIIDYIKKNPTATYKDIRKETKLHPERAFKSLKYAFEGAKMKSPRTFDIKNKETRRRIIAEYIKKHPEAGGQTIAKETKINVCNAFKGIKEAFKFAGVDYPREIDLRREEEKKKQIINLIRENPLITIQEITEKARVQPYHFFKSIKEIYKKAGVNSIKKEEKWKLKKQKEIINFIKKNSLATQREINRGCKTHVQNTFKRGIFEAYEKAEIKFPFKRLKLYGVGLKEIRDRAKTFEDEIAIKLSGYGNVNKLVKMNRGIADIVLERKDKKIIIEIKDYLDKDISVSQINQLNRYLEDSNSNLGFLICHKKPKKDKFLIGKNKIFVLEDGELNKLPIIVDQTGQ
ncbi:MAG: hypothetical protein ABIE36_01975 [Candidatus Diapherotrites archaeon]